MSNKHPVTRFKKGRKNTLQKYREKKQANRNFDNWHQMAILTINLNEIKVWAYGLL